MTLKSDGVSVATWLPVRRKRRTYSNVTTVTPTRWPPLGPVFADQLTHRKRAKSSKRSAAAVTFSAGVVIRGAASRARVVACGARIACSVVVERRRAVPTFSRLTAAPTRLIEECPEDHL